MDHSVIFKNVTKKYKMYNNTSEKLKDILVPDGYGKNFYALQNINFSANGGDVIGVIGVNGAGKSTLSNLITGIAPPTSGEITIKGQASLIAIASGLDNQLTGRDNIELKCLMLGFNKKQIHALMPGIIEFADIENFIDQPVKKYSSGMKSRLGFAISINVDPDILVIDEALSVGDRTFADKCLDKMNEFKERGKTIFFISHSIGQVNKFCQKVLWLEAGEIRAYGTTEEIIPQYQKFLKHFKSLSKEEQKNFKHLILEKRSKLRKKENIQIEKKKTDELALREQSRVYSAKRRSHKRVIKRVLIIVLFIAVLSGGAIYVEKTELLFNIQANKSEPSVIDESRMETTDDHYNNDDIMDEVENEKDIRYVMVDSAYIRAEPNLESEASGIASFGQAFIVKESKRNLFADIEWLQIISNTTSQEGWISSKVMKSIADKINDKEVANKIDNLIGFYPALEEAIPMIGKAKGEEIFFDYTEYMYAKSDLVAGFTIKVGGSSDQELFDELGEPQIKYADKILYHGSTYDFTFSILNDGTIDKLFVNKN